MTYQAQIQRIPKQDQRYVLIENICKKYYDPDERCVTVQLPIKKNKDYVYKYYDSPTHPVSTIEVLVIDDFERWYQSTCYGDTPDMYSCHYEDQYVYTFGINRISYDDKRYEILEHNLHFNI